MEVLSTKRLVFFDLETTGLDPQRDTIIQIAAIAVDQSLSELEHFEVKIRFDVESASPTALQLNSFEPGIWEEQAVTELEATRLFSAFLKRHATIRREGKRGKPFYVAQLVGHNATTFDGPFIRAFYKRLEKFFPGSLNVLCTLFRAQWYFLENAFLKAPKNYKLQTLCSYFGIEHSDEQAHDALADVRATVALYQALASTPVLNRTLTTNRARFYQDKDAPWNIYVGHNGDQPNGQHVEISAHTVASIARLLERAAKKGLTLETLIDKASSVEHAKRFAA